MKKTLLQQELAPLNAKIEQVRGSLTELQGEMRAVKAELEELSPDRQRFDLLREACKLLNRLDELEAGQLFWGELPGIEDPAGHVARLQSRVACFDDKVGGILEREAHLKGQVDQRYDELNYLYDEVDNAYDRDERRESEFAIERELSEVPHPAAIMPWSTSHEGERRFRRTLNTAIFLSLLMAIIIRMVTVPVPVRPVIARIPERLAMMVRQQPVRPEPVRKPKEERKAEKKEEKAGEKKVAKAEEKVQRPQAREMPAPARANPAPVEQTAAPKRATNTGVLAFKESFKDLLDETPVANLGSEARVSSTNRAGHALANRSLVSMQGGRGGVGGSGGIGNAAVTHNGGSGGIGDAAVGHKGSGGGNGDRIARGGNGAGFTKVKSNIAGLSGKESAKPLSAGGRPARTDEEIQLLFDRYKAALYRIYNTELRKDPTLRGKMVLRITIEPGGEVSGCKVDSCNMDAPEFADKIVARVKKINFGPKDGVPRTTILYPIDFLPAR